MKRPERNTNTEIVLRALLEVGKIEVDGKFYCFDEDYRLCQIGWDQDGKEHLLVVNMGNGITLSEFIRWCDGLSDDMVAAVGLNHALNFINR